MSVCRRRYTRSCSRSRRAARPKSGWAGVNPSARVWQAVGRRLRASGAHPRPTARLGRAPRCGRGSERPRARAGEVRSLAGAITRAGLAAMGEVVRRLGIDADHVDLRAHPPTRPAAGGGRVASRRRHPPPEHRQLDPLAGLLGKRPPTAPTGRERSSSSRTIASRDRDNLLEDLGKEELRGGD